MYELYISNIREFCREQYDEEYAKLTDADKNRIDKLKSIDSKHRTLAGRMLARKAILKLTDCVPDSIRFCTDGRGKPFVQDLGVFFSISHSGEWVVCAASLEPIGVDIERIKPLGIEFARRVCTANELGYVMDGAGGSDILDGESAARLFEVWTVKEAWFKLTGTGITNLKSVDTLSDVPHKHTQRMGEYMISIVTE
ncbi:MAG: 4'-phosphopantetheinyl transferase superfamily protein [Clostridia bacterium]|nr:4'-phosphopantetheinyl transferase superfamily protein [Clostridia bacterium]